MKEKETIITKTYDLLKYSIPILSRFPRDQKFLLGDQFQKLLTDILDSFIEAYYSKKKLPILIPVNLKLEKLRYRIRLSHDFKYISNKQYGQLSEKVDEIGRMLGGWIKKEQER
ncbi:MAG: diversity-generating retroelement protein Avd [bacterium]|nr:MAG: diversity-generating retroelement protein Avd [bacterium]